MEKIRALFIFEILGTPKEHIKNALDEFVSKIGEQKGIYIEKKKIHEPKPCEKEEMKDLFTTFAEVEVSIDDLNLLFAIVLNMLPSHVEILGPDEIKIKNFEISPILSELAIKLHRYDEVAKILALERNNLMNKIKELEPKSKVSKTKTSKKKK